VHYNPSEALVDAQQMITPDELKRTIDTCRKISEIVTLDRKKGREA
jgi:3-deoxy-7-phosphoheptulonate synthase